MEIKAKNAEVSVVVEKEKTFLLITIIEDGKKKEISVSPNVERVGQVLLTSLQVEIEDVHPTGERIRHLPE